MIRLVFHVDEASLPNAQQDGRLDIILYGAKPGRPFTGSVGNRLPAAVAALGVQVDVKAFDFLTIALAVIAADTFIDRRSKWASSGWTRSFQLEIPLAQPTTWTPVVEKLERALSFLSGDQWKLSLRADGAGPPSRAVIARRRSYTDIGAADCVSLFSGGLDSFIGVGKLVAEGRTPLLVSHAYRGDKRYQELSAPHLGKMLPRFAANAHPAKTDGTPNDTTMRTRSLGFLAYAAVAASALHVRGGGHGRVEAFVPENGFIALNAPLTRRRIGSHSTRTTHPHFLALIQEILDQIGLRVDLKNEFRHKTKGEMVAEAVAAGRQRGLTGTMSCGKWKRKNMHCGYCVPCLIRRASFASAGVDDDTPYRYDLQEAWSETDLRDDLLAMVLASSYGVGDVRMRAAASGPLPLVRRERDGWFGVYSRGLQEVGDYLRREGIRA
ncbi:Qat anti-phage system QueC-like protein QatC [Paracoccus sp. pheM1]|uniref:Qat anti-phage system QueC-like protein QatC n=1 Tax=Paracoccus sp. pheM1 TaxID=2831675 RepID=UPI001BDB766B|nr:Qat anti-phage system QueC-like protein QatC [Paracoccus sp. pheM1]MBT0780836.1 hypothetical protein [Paracoccus sp. pheM1]